MQCCFGELLCTYVLLCLNEMLEKNALLKNYTKSTENAWLKLLHKKRTWHNIKKNYTWIYSHQYFSSLPFSSRWKQIFYELIAAKWIFVAASVVIVVVLSFVFKNEINFHILVESRNVWFTFWINALKPNKIVRLEGRRCI